jgi:hypothetical protein
MLRSLLIGFLLLQAVCGAQTHGPYLGFDKNDYPGDDLLPGLHKTFAYIGFWLNNPPGLDSNPWAGRRAVVRAAGFGFLILFNGRLDAQLKGHDAAALGASDAKAAVEAAEREGFPARGIIFVDQEEGGRLLPEQAAYLGVWFAAVSKAGWRAGIYCSGIDVPEGKGTISTARDVAARFPTVKLWIFNDQCPPASGCVSKTVGPALSGIKDALVWQYAQSPRSQFAAACKAGYAADSNCYAPGLQQSSHTRLDMNTSNERDPSAGR